MIYLGASKLIRTALATLFLILPPVLFSQVKGEFLYITGSDTNHVPFMYLGSDTLDYADGGSMRTRVQITSIKLDSDDENYIVRGTLSDAKDWTPFDNFGIVMRGKIELIIANTWLGEMKTGKIVRDSKMIRTKKGKFKIKVPIDYQDYLIFTAEGGATVVDIPFKELLDKNFKE